MAGTDEGAEQAAILLLALGETQAAGVLQQLPPRDVKRVSQAMSTLGGVSRGRVQQVLERFTGRMAEDAGLGADPEQYLRSVLTQALGEDQAKGLLDRVLKGRGTKGLEALEWMEARTVARLLASEHPQVIALVLSYLDAEQGAEVLNELPETTAGEVVLRLASIDEIDPRALQQLDEILERQISSERGGHGPATLDGVNRAAGILNALDAEREQALMDHVRNADSELSEQIEERMFVFDDLARVDARSMQRLLREVDNDRLIIALKGADEAVSEAVFANMSRRAADNLRDELELAGPVRVSEVDAAQKEILATARRLADAEEITLGGRGGDALV
jgi:flagellar motor switch protein FliG